MNMPAEARRARFNPFVWAVAGLTLYVTQFVMGIPFGLLVERLLGDIYAAHPEFWRPELNREPPNTRALAPMWVGFGVLGAFVHAAIFLALRDAFQGATWLRGLKYAVVASLIQGVLILGYFGVFALPGSIWLGWWVQRLLVFMMGGSIMGLVVGKLSPAPASG